MSKDCDHKHTYDYEVDQINNKNASIIIQKRCVICDKLISQRLQELES